MAKDDQNGRKVACSNRKARHDYHVVDVLEAGIVLEGSEVKSLRNGGGVLSDAYGEIKDGEAYLVNAHIAGYSSASYNDHEPRRRRKLLLHGREIRRLEHKAREKGFTLVPLSIYFVHGLAKVELALARGRRTYDKRERILKRDLARVSTD